MVLGGLMETKLRTAMARVETPWDFINRPIAFVLFSMIVIAIVLHVVSVVRDRKKVAGNA